MMEREKRVEGKASVEQPQQVSLLHGWLRWCGGLAFTFAIAAVSFGLGKLPGPDRIGPLACAILIAVLYRQIAGYPEALRPGIQFASQKLLRLAIILFGLRLNMNVVLTQGLGLLARGAVVITFSLAATLLLAKWLKADASLSLLVGVGTGICGAAAIAAVSPIVRAKEEDTAIGVGLIALVGTLFAVGYAVLRPFLPFGPEQYGAWAGISLHEIAHVALAGAPAGNDGLAMALLAKLGRVFLLVPVCFVLLWRVNVKAAGQRRVHAGQGAGEKEGGAAPATGHKGAKGSLAGSFPWFLLGFVAMSLVGSYGIGNVIPVPQQVLDGVSALTSFLLTMAMIGLGLNVSLREVRNRALRPLLVLVMVSFLLSGLALLLV